MIIEMVCILSIEFQFSVAAVAAFSSGAYLRMKQGPPVCFVAGTMVLTVSGLVAIENIKAGDTVISTNPDTMEMAVKEVLETYVRETNMLVHLTINDEQIITTMNHPFYVKEHGFIEAGGLWLGANVVNSNGLNACVTKRLEKEIMVVVPSQFLICYKNMPIGPLRIPKNK